MSVSNASRPSCLRRISVRLYFYLGLSVTAITGLSTSVIWFAADTDRAARHLYDDGFLGVLKSAQIDLLLEKHGRLVESLPSQMDRAELDAKDRELGVIEQQLRAVVSASRIDQFLDSAGVRTSAHLSALFTSADDVQFFAREFAQDKASENAREYSRIAGDIARVTQRYRDFQLQRAQAAGAAVAEAASKLTIWAILGAFSAALLVGPLGVATMHRVLVRLRRITAAMTRLAADDLRVIVPSQGDRDEVGEMARAVAVFKTNAIQLREQDFELRELNSRIDIALNNMTHGLCMFGEDGRLIVCNKTYQEMYGLTPELARPGTLRSDMHARRAEVGTLPRDEGAEAARNAVRVLENGRVISVSRRPMPGGGWVAVHEDITVRHEAEAEIAHLARHDVLTSLPNRFSFREQLVSVLSSNTGCALHCLDLDNFKDVNDTLGHPVGDQLLKQVGARLLANTRAGDHVARLGGDEFAIIQRNVADPVECGRLASRLIEALSAPYEIDGRQIVIGASIGLAMSPDDGDHPDHLFKKADLALYAAKQQRGDFCRYQSSMGDEFQKRVSLERDLREAIVSGEFEVHYQPIVSLATGQVTSFEALVRWRSPSRGLVSPADFIPLAEQTGLIDELGEWVLRRAVEDAALWPSDISLAVNLSAEQLRGTRLVSVAADALARSGLAARRLELEITETALLDDEHHAREVLGCLRNMGVRISLDDFGTGYSSLSYLRSFPFDKIKIDQSFVRDILVRPDCRAIICAITTLAETLGLNTTAEGIETAEQLDEVTAVGCREGQGYLFAKPMPIDQVMTYLAREPVRTAA